MIISAYQINNVLRVYGEQLRRGRISKRQRSTDTKGPDKISISANARRETIIDGITSNIIERITQFEPHGNVEKDVLNMSLENLCPIMRGAITNLYSMKSMKMVKP